MLFLKIIIRVNVNVSVINHSHLYPKINEMFGVVEFIGCNQLITT